MSESAKYQREQMLFKRHNSVRIRHEDRPTVKGVSYRSQSSLYVAACVFSFGLYYLHRVYDFCLLYHIAKHTVLYLLEDNQTLIYLDTVKVTN